MVSENMGSREAIREAVNLIHASEAQKAADLLKGALGEDPENAEMWSLHSQALASLKDYKGAMKSIQRSLSLDGGNALNWQLKGTYLLRLGKILDAVKAIDEALKLKPSPVSYILRGQAEYNRGMLNDAELFFQLALAEDPENALANQMMGLTLFGKKKFADAVPYLDKALSHVKSEHLEKVLDECRKKSEEILGSH
ncbi:MAG TPA: tetratricopeptide repeat protein [Candidatus Bathyarchaeia archaeon]